MEICNQHLFNKIPDIKLNGIFNYYENKINIIEFDIINKTDDFEFIVDVNNNSLTIQDEEEKNKYLKELDEEILKIKKVIEYLLINVDILKIQIENFKIYDYSSMSKHIRNKIKCHNFDIKHFITKNKINKNNLTNIIKETLNTTNDINLNEYKLMSSFILLEILNIYNNYNKKLIYSKQLLEEIPIIIKDKETKLVKIDKTIINLSNDEILINHNGNIKNSYATNNKIGMFICIKKNKDKNFVISFK